jgi:hypothetical protein
MFDAQTAVGRAIFFFETLVQIEDGLVGAIADGVYGDVEPGAVGGLEIGEELIGMGEVFGGESGVAGSIVEGLKEPRRA